MSLFHKITNIVQIAGDGAIGNPDLADGRLIPVLILDCCTHPPLEDFILAQKDSPPGDVTTKWAWNLISKKKVYLTFQFHRPVETSAAISFNVSDEGGLVDWIINARGVYIQPLSSGASVSEGIGNPKVLVEVPPTTTFTGWNGIYLKSLEQSYRRRGLSKTQARSSAKDHMAHMREIQFRGKR